jgi:hypothetical protein
MRHSRDEALAGREICEPLWGGGPKRQTCVTAIFGAFPWSLRRVHWPSHGSDGHPRGNFVTAWMV